MMKRLAVLTLGLVLSGGGAFEDFAERAFTAIPGDRRDRGIHQHDGPQTTHKPREGLSRGLCALPSCPRIGPLSTHR